MVVCVSWHVSLKNPRKGGGGGGGGCLSWHV